jgi:hypothetical protein
MSKKTKIHNQLSARSASPRRRDKECREAKTSFPPNLNNKTTPVAWEYPTNKPHYLIKNKILRKKHLENKVMRLVCMVYFRATTEVVPFF